MLDIDGTLLETTMEKRTIIVGKPQNYSHWLGHTSFGSTIYRKGLFAMLIQARQHCNIVIYTAGSTTYAVAMADQINTQVSYLS